jgi:hypothetical protein
VVIATSGVLIEHFFGGHSLQVVPAQTARPGKVNYAGMFTLRVEAGLRPGERAKRMG